ncbi:VOC family protein [Brevundimonas subvibrioides]|uniref:Glyoxalase/bleomycin resistance protein/dioxygenase n=1 Tax=Brevundimonas subvibrioides (strain ATCC 15264 / DSM 4735 / LMG 14903 / NBRC 16000 / CB 81) TaxID=633149 RepID=D9QP65_BRESC|nr:VOC family protein [Brevundimonas subvibrioides]ADL02328.1 Glyoxalase/bleomycin resistance protein/dioxygenase [Brevundimonas subvibrioides ATCC 15264]
MLKARNSAAIVAVKDIARSRAFYGETLGLNLAPDSGDDPTVFQTGDTRLIVYVSEFAGTNKANALVWGVGEEIESIVRDLAAKGVTFERYDLPEATYADGIHRMGDFRAAWFKDPDGNILHINSGS